MRADTFSLQNLNNDQLDGLAKLCFDLAKGALLIALFPTPSLPSNPNVQIINTFVGVITALAFTYIALVLLKTKGKHV